MEMPSTFSGGCLCAAIRYACSAQPIFTSGAAYLPIIIVRSESLKIIKGNPKARMGITERGNEATRIFCADSGSQLFGLNSSKPEFAGVKAGTLDHPGCDLMDLTLPKISKGTP
ncbi:MAG TPA: GFA family protein [Steroidobacteraceae bacterium]